MRRDHSHAEKLALLRELEQEKSIRQQRRRQAFWANLPKFFIPGGIAALIAGVLLALPAYQQRPDIRGLWSLFVFGAPGTVIILIGLVALLWQILRGRQRK